MSRWLGIVSIWLSVFWGTVAFAAAPAITTPATAGSMLPGDSYGFTWASNGAAVTGWRLKVGSSFGGGQYYDSGVLPSTTTYKYVDSALPTNGSTVYVRLRYQLAGVWANLNYTYTAAPGKPILTSPTPGSTLTSSNATFTWNNNGVTAIDQWWLTIGTTAGASDLYDGAWLAAGTTSQLVGRLPTDGQTLYVTLKYRIQGSWQAVKYTYKAFTGAPAPDPSITSPTQGSTLSGTSVTFNWSSYGTPIKYWMVYVGKTVGGAEYYNGFQNDGATTGSAVVNGLPTDGSTVYVRLSYVFATGGSWLYRDFTFATAAPPPPAITSPAPGSVFTSTNANFTWVTNGTNVANWQLLVGKSVGTSEYFSSATLAAETLSQSVTTLPMDGSTVHVRLRYLVGTTWNNKDYTYTAVRGQPAITSPSPGASLPGSSVEFAWAANGLPITSWQLLAGKSPGVPDYYDSGDLSAATLRKVVAGLPRDGSTVHVRLRYQSDGVWKSLDYTYTAAVGQPAITSPAPGTTLPGPSVTFTWTADGLPMANWQLWVGKSLGASDIHNSGDLPAATLSGVVAGLPKDGGTVYVRLRYLFAGVWKSLDYTYTAAVGQPTITSPAPGTTLPGSSVTFTWTADGLSVANWQLWVGKSPGASDIHNSGDLSAATLSRQVGGLPVFGGAVYVRLHYLSAGVWRNLDYTYTAATVATPPPWNPPPVDEAALDAAFQHGKDLAAGGNTANGVVNGTLAQQHVPGYNNNPKESGLYGDGKKDLSGDGYGKQAACASASASASTTGFAGQECNAINFLGDGRPGYTLSKDDALFDLSRGITKDNRDAWAGLGSGNSTGGCVKTIIKNPDLKTVEHCEEWLVAEEHRCPVGRVVTVDKDVNYQCDVTTAQKVSHECHKKLTVTCQTPADGCDANGVVLGGTSGDMKWDVSKSGGNMYMTFGTIANDYWGSGVYDRSGTFTINKMSDVSLFSIDHAWFDDWVWVKINNTTVYVGPKGGDRLDTDVYINTSEWASDIKTGTWLAANGYTKTEEGYTNESFTYTPHQAVFYDANNYSGYELKTSWDKPLSINIAPYLREGSNTIWVRTVVGGRGESAIRMVTRQFCPPTCTDSWADGCAGYNR